MPAPQWTCGRSPWSRACCTAQDVNFARVWEEYEKLEQLNPHPDHHPRPLAWRAYEALFDCRLLVWSNLRCRR